MEATNNRELVYENKPVIDRTIATIDQNINGLNDLIIIYNELNMGPINTEDLKDILFDNCQKTEVKYNRVLEKEIKGLKIKNPTLIKNLKADANNEIDLFRSSVQYFKSKIGFSDEVFLNYVTIENGKALVTEESLEKLREANRVYVESSNGLKLRELHLEAVRAMNEFIAAIKQGSGTTRCSDSCKFINLYFKRDDQSETFEVHPLFYDAIANHSKD